MTLKNLFHNHYLGECPVDDTILGTNGFYIIFMYIHCVNKIISLDSEYMGLLWYVYSFSTNQNKNNMCRSFRGNSRKHIVYTCIYSIRILCSDQRCDPLDLFVCFVGFWRLCVCMFVSDLSLNRDMLSDFEFVITTY